MELGHEGLKNARLYLLSVLLPCCCVGAWLLCTAVLGNTSKKVLERTVFFRFPALRYLFGISAVSLRQLCS